MYVSITKLLSVYNTLIECYLSYIPREIDTINKGYI